MRGFDKKFNRMRHLIIGFISVVALLLVAQLIVVGFVIYTVADSASEQDWSGGIKPVVEKIWCGRPGCTDT